jgi:excisionase family DNA binding protein
MEKAPAGRNGEAAEMAAQPGPSLTETCGGVPMASRTHEPEPLLTPAEVASMFRVDPKTVTRWAKAGKLSAIRTLGGHRRYRESEVRALLQGQIPQQRQGD